MCSWIDLPVVSLLRNVQSSSLNLTCRMVPFTLEYSELDRCRPGLDERKGYSLTVVDTGLGATIIVSSSWGVCRRLNNVRASKSDSHVRSGPLQD